MSIKKFGVFLVATAMTGIMGTAACADDTTLPDVKSIVSDAMPSIVAITNESVETVQYRGRAYQWESESSGSGIIVAKTDDELLIATNNHVVENASDLTVVFSVDTEDEDDAMVSAKVKGTDSSLDLAVVAVDLDDIDDDVADQISVISIGDSDSVEVGDWAIAIGNALGYGQSVTFGIVSAKDREVTLEGSNGNTITNDMIQTDAAINFGNSGGALLDANGNLIGINSAKAASSGVEGMGYAIPINTAKSVIEDLMNQTTREKVEDGKGGALGIRVTDVSEEARQIYNMPSGAYVYEVTEGSAAEDAGLRQGDVITKLDKTTITSTSELLNRMEYYAAGEDVEVTVQRMSDDGYVEKVFTVTLQEKSDDTDDAEEETTEDAPDQKEGASSHQGNTLEENGFGDWSNGYYGDAMGYAF